MINIPIEELIAKTGSVYQLVNAAARRSAELTGGLLPLIPVKNLKTTTIALEEIRQGKVSFKPKEK